ncbi:MAG: S-methyl-5-thioribose kinase [Verrucomicrobia bacterium]|nr:S-methyl-5-thioribose kinase [Verrucomicrobiota bacterium]
MDYEILTAETLPNYIRQTKSLSEILGGDSFQIKEVGDGNLNYVYIVEGSQNAIIVKQSVPFLRCVGESWQLSKDRMLSEIAALKKFYELAPDHVPEVYHADPAMCLVAMRYLGDHIILRKGLIAAEDYPHFAEHASSFLANTLFKTSSFFLSSKEKSELEAQFNTNHDLCKLSEDLIFTFPYMTHDSNHHFSGMERAASELRSDSEFKRKVLSLKYRFMTQKDALLHGDLHTGSIMVNRRDTFVIDPEFAFFGPFGFDIGALIANFILSYVSHAVCDADKSYSNGLLSILREFLEKFQTKFLGLIRSCKDSAVLIPGFFNEEELERYYQELVLKMIQEGYGFAGCKMARRILGLAGVADIRGIDDPEKRLAAEKMALGIARDLVKTFDQIKDPLTVIDRIAHAQ